MKKNVILVLAVILFLCSCEAENMNGFLITGVWREGNQYNSFTNSWDNVGSCEIDDTREFTNHGNYIFNPGTQNCGKAVTGFSYTRTSDTILINGTTMWLIQSLSASELIYSYRVSYGTGFVWNKHKLIR